MRGIKIGGLVIFTGVAGVVGLGALLTVRAASSGGGQSLSQAPQFPTVEGSNLSRQRFTLPADIEGDYAVVTIAYEQRQQADVDTWIPAMRRLVEQYENVIFYELPTIRKLPKIGQAWVDGGMRAGIRDPYTRDTTITLYLDKQPFREALQIAGESRINTLIIDAEGEVYWRADGPATEEKLASLETTLEELLSSGQ